MNERIATGAVLVGGNQAAATPTGCAPAELPVDALALRRVRVSWLHVISVAAVSILAVEFLHPVAYHLPALRSITEGAITLLAILAALLFAAQFAHTRRLRDLVLMAALVAFALLELVSNAIPAALEIHSGSELAVSMQLGQLLVALALAAAAAVPSSKLVVGFRRPVWGAVGLGVLGFVAAELGGLGLRNELLAVASRPVFGIGHALARPLAVVVVIGTAALLLDAAARFSQRGRAERSGAMPLLAGAAILLGVARLYYLALPWVSPDWISSRELLRLVAFGLIAAAAARQEFDLRAAMTRAAAIAERLRVARDLHDGLAQDLAFIAAHGARIADERGADDPLVVAARSALAVSRGAISDLSDTSSATLPDALEAVADELRPRFGIAVAVHADAGAELARADREQVLRITREAIANAARHGQAKNVIVSLASADGGVALRVCDDGTGILAGAPTAPADGFGLRSMRERAAALSGSLTVSERPGGGTELEVLLP